MRYFRLDLVNLNISFKLTFDDYNLYEYLFNYCIQNLDSTSDTNICKINQYDIYVSLKFNLANINSNNSLVKIVNFIKNLYYFTSSKSASATGSSAVGEGSA